MTFYLFGIRSFPKLWKSPYLGLGPGQSYASLFLADSCGIRNQQKLFSLKTMSPQNTKATNLIAKARYLRKDEGSNKQVYSVPHFFSAGAAKKRSQINSQSEDHALPPVRNTIQLPTQPLNSEEWDKLKADLKGNTGKTSFESWIISQMVRYHSSIDVAKSLLAWVAAKNNGIISYDLLVKYLYLCVFHMQTSEVIDVFEIMKARYKTLEPGGYTLLIRGLIHSDRWREALLLLEDIKKVMTPSKKNYNDCIQGALLHQDVNTAWNLYQELLGHDIVPMLETLKAFFDFGKDIKDDNYSNKLLDILSYLRNNQLYPGESFAHSIKTWFESGQCSACGKTIESIQLSPEEYEYLKGKIMRDVIDGGDQYKKTTPQTLAAIYSARCCPRHGLPGTAGARHRCLPFLLWLQARIRHVGHAGRQLLTPSALPASASRGTGTADGVSLTWCSVLPGLECGGVVWPRGSLRLPTTCLGLPGCWDCGRCPAAAPSGRWGASLPGHPSSGR
ncbi:mitochondrial ribonuclease P catalytic subunit isoform X6 [Symphalangus syndactylus]|uniref:mitochondrial ribonuclease P catalytic subunit isoform X6 n=1 Tax=Symphalangus syndactylus TaxID=9590 RepID=UPI003004448B